MSVQRLAILANYWLKLFLRILAFHNFCVQLICCHRARPNWLIQALFYEELRCPIVYLYFCDIGDVLFAAFTSDILSPESIRSYIKITWIPAFYSW